MNGMWHQLACCEQDFPTQSVKSDFVPQPGEFFFSSPFRSLRTQGCFMRIQSPAFGGENMQGAFQQLVQRAFAKARQAGISQPVICGAVPFDTRQPCSLFIPKETQWFARKPADTALASLLTRRVVDRRLLPEHDEFISMVSQGLQAIKHQQVEKVVLGRIMELQTAQEIDQSALMQQLLAQVPDAYHFYLPMAQGTLLGASPELLLRKIGAQFFTTPLAGSARRSTDPQQDQKIAESLLASPKDNHEHQIVTDSIRRLLSAHCHQLNIPEHPQLIHTPTLWHLASQISGEVHSTDHNALSLACLLHPTPALGGMPAQTACELIKCLEPFDRGLFGGLVGWCDEQGNGEWVVAIRCGLVNGRKLRLFAGAGIVAGSEPASEWQETATKLQTMLNAFGLSLES
jgi:isochorismate synthase